MITWKQIKDFFYWGYGCHDPLEDEPISKATVEEVEVKNSTISFELDKDLNVTVHTKINKDVILGLVDQEYITSTESEEEGAIQIAFILIANEITEQLIEKINNNAKEFDN